MLVLRLDEYGRAMMNGLNGLKSFIGRFSRIYTLVGWKESKDAS